MRGLPMVVCVGQASGELHSPMRNQVWSLILRVGQPWLLLLGGLLLLLMAGEFLLRVPLPGEWQSWQQEIRLVFKDSSSQWMLFLFLGIHLVMWAWVWGKGKPGARSMERETGAEHRTLNIEQPTSNGGIWRVGLLALGMMLAGIYHLAADYNVSTRNTDALVFFSGLPLFFLSAVAFQGVPARSIAIGGLVVLTLICLPCLFTYDFLRLYEYRGQRRWTGIWDNPNTFGLVMSLTWVASSAAIAAGLSAWLRWPSALDPRCSTAHACAIPAAQLRRSDMIIENSQEPEKPHRGDMKNPAAPTEQITPSNAVGDKHNGPTDQGAGLVKIKTAGLALFNSRPSTLDPRPSVVFLLALIPLILSGLGLVRSYSRGAWVAAAIGTGMVLWQFRREIFFGDCTRLSTGFQRRCREYFLPLLLILVAGSVWAFWEFRTTEQRVVRRAFSFGNRNDFSWRNRVAAYEGALKLMVDRPWAGWGWNQVQNAYDTWYLPPRLTDSAAITVNDYGLLGATLGLPALGCFLVFVLRQFGNGSSSRRKEAQTSGFQDQNRGSRGGEALTLDVAQSSRPGTGIFKPPDDEHRTSNVQQGEWLELALQACLAVLLIGFFFDGGLFRLALAGPFWMLMGIAESRRKDEV